ncbi:MAG: hypothetical protein WAV54_06240 [Acidimicrobiales bacterium]
MGSWRVIACTMVVLLAVACSTAQTTPTTALHGPSSSVGLLPASPQLRTRIVLGSTRVKAGTPIQGTLFVTNHSSSAINLTENCRPQYEVALMNARFPPEYGFFLSCLGVPLLIHPGVNRLPIEVRTTYMSCTETPSTASASSIPRCTATGLPPMPDGRYEAVLVGEELPLPAPVPVTVTLVGAG